MNTDLLFDLIVAWGKERGILDKATVRTQFEKLMEEVLELHEAIVTDNEKEFKDAVGDCVVVLTLLCKLKGVDINNCVNIAYNVIKERTGKMVNGTFVKDK
jgi:NTP pyrophosphatase (non-canonical NTP hydrolase)